MILCSSLSVRANREAETTAATLIASVSYKGQVVIRKLERSKLNTEASWGGCAPEVRSWEEEPQGAGAQIFQEKTPAGEGCEGDMRRLVL